MSVEKTEASADPKQIAVELLGKITWSTDHKGFCLCPGHRRHTTNTGRNDCAVYLDGTPTVFCLHQSCREECRQISSILRQALAGHQTDSATVSGPEKKQRDREVLRRLRLEQRAQYALPTILKQYSWTYDSIQADSPSPIGKNAEDHWWDLLHLFQPGDLIWIGNTYDSGTEAHAKHFLSREEWMGSGSLPAGQLICTATFKNSSFSRSNENVLYRRFLVVESDVLDRNQVGAIFRWMREAVGMSLRAVVDTAGKSLHGWFDFPQRRVLDELEIMLPYMGCDPGLFKPSQPVRLPGALRGKKHQSLIFLDNGGQSK